MRGRRGVGLDRLDGTRGLQPAERRIEGSVRHPSRVAEGLAQSLLQFVAVELLLFEEPQDGEFEHPSPISIYRNDTSAQQVVQQLSEPAGPPQGPGVQPRRSQ